MVEDSGPWQGGGGGHRRQRYSCPARRSMSGAAEVRRKRSLRFVISLLAAPGFGPRSQPRDCPGLEKRAMFLPAPPGTGGAKPCASRRGCLKELRAVGRRPALVSERILYLIRYTRWMMNAAELLERVPGQLRPDPGGAGAPCRDLPANPVGVRARPEVSHGCHLRPDPFRGGMGTGRASRTFHSPGSRPRGAGRYGFRTAAATGRGARPRGGGTARCTSTGPHQDVRSTCGRAPTGRACTRSSCRREGPPTSSLTSTARCSPTCGTTWSCRGRSGRRGHRWSGRPAEAEG